MKYTNEIIHKLVGYLLEVILQSYSLTTPPSIVSHLPTLSVSC